MAPASFGWASVGCVRDKQAYRERAWDLLTSTGVARFPGARGRIPNFMGAEAAARALASSPEWQAAGTVKSTETQSMVAVFRLFVVKRFARTWMYLALSSQASIVEGEVV